jgi:exodeoxyribonuclease-3
MQIVSWNVNGIRSLAKKGFSEWLKDSMPDILALQEVRALEEQIPAEVLDFPEYKRYWSSAEKKGYSGVGVYTKEEPLEVIRDLGIEEFDREGRMLLLVFADFVLYNIYFPNGSSSDERLSFKMRFYDAWLEHAQQWKEQGKEVICCGDFNTCHKEIDIARPKANAKRSGFLPEERAWMDKLVDSGFVDSFRYIHPDAKDRYSWWSNRGGARERNVGWRIDYFFVSEQAEKNIQDAEIWDQVMGSDHCPIVLDYRL